MRRFIAPILSITIASLIGCSPLGSKAQEMIGTQAPESRLMFFDGSEVPLSSYQGKNVAVLFWATWCTFSREVIERYESLARQYSQTRDIEFIAVSIDKNEDFGTLKDRVKEQDLKTMTHIFSGNDALDDAFVNLNGKHIPYVVFIDTTGTIRLVDTDITSLEEYLLLRFGTGRGARVAVPRYSETASLDE
jgi:thiol-disulfide isomerase/thioredoxin